VASVRVEPREKVSPRPTKRRPGSWSIAATEGSKGATEPKTGSKLVNFAINWARNGKRLRESSPKLCERSGSSKESSEEFKGKRKGQDGTNS